MWDYMGKLEEAVRTGRPAGGLHDRPAGDPWWESYMRGLFEISQLRAGQIAKLIPARRPRTLLDLAGGHGGFSVAMCRRHPALEATVFELEGAAKVGERIVAEEGMSQRVRYLVGDMWEGDLGAGYDVAMANSILHHFGPDEDVKLLERIRGALAPGGTMAVVEQERPPEGKRGNQVGALTGMLFYVSSKVRTYTAAELAGFLRRAGFEDVKPRRHLMVPGVVVVTGRNPA
jgi:cyclopropane fatty-acyl-phospholipid synthase-like methyltransferase